MCFLFLVVVGQINSLEVEKILWPIQRCINLNVPRAMAVSQMKRKENSLAISGLRGKPARKP